MSTNKAAKTRYSVRRALNLMLGLSIVLVGFSTGVIVTAQQPQPTTGSAITVDFSKYADHTPISTLSEPYVTFVGNGNTDVEVAEGKLWIEGGNLGVGFATDVSQISFDWESAGSCATNFTISLYKGQQLVNRQPNGFCATGTFSASVDFNFMTIEVGGPPHSAESVKVGNFHFMMPRLPVSTEGPTPRYPPTLVPAQATATDEAQHILLQDSLTDASNPNNWYLTDNHSDRISFTDKGLVVTVYKPMVAWSYVGAWYPADIDVTVMAEAVRPIACDSYFYTVLIRGYDDDDDNTHFYGLDVLPGGRWIFTSFDTVNGFGPSLAGGLLPKSFDIFRPNELRIVAKGTHFDLYMNKARIGAADDPDEHMSVDGQYMLALGTETCTPPATSVFKNILVSYIGQ